MLGAPDPRDARRQKRLMLKEVQMPPGLVVGVIHRARLLGASPPA
jgi:hypothetical protein